MVSIYIYDCTLFYVSRKRVTRFFDVSQERITHFFDMSRERITRFFDVSREMDPRASSGKFLRVENCYPESFRFLGLWCLVSFGDSLLLFFLNL